MRATVERLMNARPITSPAKCQLKVTSDPANLAAVRKQVEALAASIGFAEKAVSEIGLCVNEAMANIIRHAYAGRTDRPIHLDASATPREMTVTLRDWGNGIDPSRVPCRPYDPLEPGGVGLICLGQWMDEVTYTPQPDGMLTTLKRKLAK
jgi:serine/threonine-protein kinase RsbW